MTNPDRHASTPEHDELRVDGPVVVTGAANGIGAAVVAELRARGVAVALLDRDRDRLDAIRTDAETSDAGAPLLAVPCDVTSAQSVDQAFEDVTAKLGAVRGLVVSAGIDRGGPTHEFSYESWDEVIAVNLTGAFLTIRAALSPMLEAEGGSIVCVSSPFASVAPAGGASAYCASKGGLSALVGALAVEYAAQGIRVNAVLPGPTETQLMWAGVDPDQVETVREKLRREVPIGRLADPREPARAIVWLLSRRASYITGAQLSCDGGVLAKASVSV